MLVPDSFRRWLRRRFSSALRPGRPTPPRRRVSKPVRADLLAELLEERLAPATFAVNSTLDKIDLTPGNGMVDTGTPGEITLRAAIMEANSLPGADTITLGTGTYRLSIEGTEEDAGATGDLDILGTSSLTLNGVGAAQSIIDGFNVDRVFHNHGVTVTMNGVTIKNGRTDTHGTPIDGNGGAINNRGTLTLNACQITNSFGTNGGAIYNAAGATINLNDSTLSNNLALDFGGGLFNAFVANVTRSTLWQNNALDDGGGIVNDGALSVLNSTISDNLADQDGGGIVNRNSGNVNLQYSTVTLNRAGDSGGGIVFASGTGFFASLSSIIAGNSATTISADLSGIFLSDGNNLIGSNGGGSGFTDGVNGDIVGANPMLGPLQHNGGLTFTHAILAGSPAIDTGKTAGAPSIDQRGFPRPIDGDENASSLADIGAFERNPPPQILAVIADGNVVAGSERLVHSVTQTIVRFSEDLVLGGPGGVTNLSNWSLTRSVSGVPQNVAITAISFGLNNMSGEFEAVLTHPVLTDGDYSLVIEPTIADLGGTLLDTDGDGEQGSSIPNSTGDYILPFSVNLPIPRGEATRVNTVTDFVFVRPNLGVAMDADGDFVIASHGYNEIAGTYGINAQRYSAAGVPVGAEVLVNSDVTFGKTEPAAAMDADGDYVVVWSSDFQDLDQTGVYGQRFSRDGVAQGLEFRVNTTTTRRQEQPAVAMDADGDFVVVWQSYDQEGPYSGFGIYAQRYSAAGTPVGGEFRVNTETTNWQTQPAVAMDADGKFVVTWTSFSQDGDAHGVYAQRYDADGTTMGGEFRVANTTTGDQLFPAIGMDSAGKFTIAWQGNMPGSEWNVYARRYDEDGTPIANEFRVNTTTALTQWKPGIAVDSDGDFVVVWESVSQVDGTASQDGSAAGIYGQRYSSTGAAIGSEFRVNDDTPGTQEVPFIAADADGDFVVAWTGFSASDINGAYFQRFGPNALPPFVEDVIVAGDPVQENERLVQPVSQLIVTFSEGVSTAGGASGAESVTNPANWQLINTGENNSSRISGITYGFNTAFNRPAATLSFSTPLVDGFYQLTAIAGSIKDLTGIALDGNADTTAGDSFVRNFTVNRPISLGPEARVNTTTANEQAAPSIASEDNGDYVVVWQGFPDGSGGYGIYGQRYTSSGATIGNEFLINTTVAPSQFDPAVAMDADGDFVVAWTSGGQDGSGFGVYARRYDNAGNPVGNEFLVTTTTANDEQQPAVAMDNAGNFVIVWMTTNLDGDGFGVFGQRYDPTGDTFGGEFVINTTTAGGQSQPSIAMDAGGNFVVAWRGNGAGDGDGVFARVFDSTGMALGVEVRVNTTVLFSQLNPSVSRAANGNFVVVWAGDQTLDFDVYAQRFDPAGSPLGAEIRVNTTTADSQMVPSVAMDSDGDFVVTWQALDGDAFGVFGQRFNTLGVPVGSEFRVNATIANEQANAAVAMDSDGDFVIAWEANGATDPNDVFLQHFGPNTQPVATGLDVEVNEDAPDTVVDLLPRFTDATHTDAQLTYSIVGGPNFNATLEGTNVRIDYSPDAYGASSIFVFATDPGGFFANSIIEVRILPVQDAPVLVNRDFEFEIHKDATAATNTGFYVVDLMTGVSDVDQTDGRGIAIIGADQSNGTIEYSIDDGSSWFELGTVNDSEALLLAADGQTKVRFVPNPSFFGTVDEAITFRAWDQSSGAPTLKVDATVTGDATPFSSGSDTVRIIRNHKVGPEVRVNTTTDNAQSRERIARNPDGRFVVVWQGASTIPADTTWDIFAQVYDAQSNPVGGEIQVNTTTVANQEYPAVAIDDAGNFVVVWEHETQTASGQDIRGRRFNANGTPRDANDFRVTSSTINQSQVTPDVAMDAAGNFVVVFASNVQDGSQWGVFCRRFNAAGVAQGNDTVVSTTTSANQQAPSIDMLANGEYVVVWQSNSQAGGGGSFDIVARAFFADGTARTAEALVNVGARTNDQIEPDIALSPFGEVTVVWQSFGQPGGSGWDIFVSRFDEPGVPADFTQPVNTQTAGDQTAPVVAVDPARNFAVAWIAPDIDNNVRVTWFDSGATPLEADIVVPGPGLGNKTEPDIGMNRGGDFVVAWHGAGPGDLFGVFFQEFQFSGRFEGIKFWDQNADGVRDPDGLDNIAGNADDESGLPGWTIYTDDNVNGQLDPGEFSTITDANGNYVLGPLAPFNTYMIGEVLRPGWKQTYPRFIIFNGLSPTGLESGDVPVGMVTEDFDDDGDIDIAVAINRAGQDVVRILYNNGDSQFSTFLDIPVQDGPFEIATFTGGNGLPNLVVTNFASGTVTVLGNVNPPGTFPPAQRQNLTVGMNPWGINAVDLNTDGQTDLAVVNSGSANVSILLANGTGGFHPAVSVGVGFIPTAVSAGDVNGDGFLDLAVSNSSDNNVSVLINNGSGVFTGSPLGPFVVGNGPRGVVVRDFDGDTVPDLAVANHDDDDISILKNLGGSGAGWFGFGNRVDFTTADPSDFGSGDGPASLNAADFDQDGDWDLIVNARLYGGVSILTGNGDGTFGEGDNFGGSAGTDFNATGDFDGDGLPDYVNNAPADSALQIRLNRTGQLALWIAPDVPLIVDFGNDNSLPTTGGISPVNVLEDAADTVISLWNVFADPEDTDAQLTFSITGNTNPGLFAAVQPNNATGELRLDFASNANGIADVTVRATDRGGLFTDTTFRVTITPDNDQPTWFGILPVNVNEDAQDTTIPLFPAFADVEDADANLTFTVSNNTNPGLFAAVSINQATGQLTLDYTPNANGTAIITVRATDTGAGSNGAPVPKFFDGPFEVTVAPDNDQPTTTGIATVSVVEGTPTSVVSLFNAFADVEEPDANLVFSVVGDPTNPSLFTAPPTINASNGQLTISYSANAVGSSQITVRATDTGAGSSGAPAPKSVDTTFDVNVLRVLSGTGENGFNPSSLVKLKTSPAAQTLLGPAGYNGGLDFDSRGVLFGAGDSLQVIDPTTRAMQIIGSLHNATEAHFEVRGIAFAPNGQLFGISHDSRLLYRIDPATAFVTVIGPIVEDVWGIDFTAGGTLYAAGTKLVTLNPATGDTISVIATLTNAVADVHLASDGFLYAAGSTNSALYRIDPANGAQTLLGNYTSQLRGLAVQQRGPLAPDFAEPNDARLNATDFGVVSGESITRGLSIHSSGNQDWYRFELTSPGTAGNAAQISFVDTLGDLDLALFDANGTFLTQSATAGATETISLAGRAAGVYFVRVVGFSGATNPAYTLTISAPAAPVADFVDVAGAGDSLAAAHNLGVVEGTYTLSDLSIDSAGDDDWFRFTMNLDGTANHSVALEFGNVFGNLDLALYDSAGNIINSSLGSTDRESILLDGLRAGTYFARVFGSGATNRSYRLVLQTPQPGAADFAEPNDSRATAYNLGMVEGRLDVADLSVHQAGNADWFQFQTAQTASAGHFVNLSFTHALGDLDLFLFNSVGTEVQRSTTVGDVERVSMQGLPAGTYFVRVSGYLDATNPHYDLSLQMPLGQIDPDRLEFNDSPAQPTELDLSKGDVSLADLSVHASDVDVFRIQTTQMATASDSVSITFQRADGDLTLQILDDDAGNTLLRTATGGSGDFESLSLDGLAAGTYFVRVMGDANRYDLKVDASVAAGQVDDWTIVVYMTASDLAGRAKNDIEELELAASRLPGTVNIAVYLDQSDTPEFRFATGGAAPWGDAGRAFLTPDVDLSSIVTVFERLGEQSSGNPQTFEDFVTWAVDQRPAARYGLVLWGHGSGVFGSNIDDQDAAAANRLPVSGLSTALADLLTNHGIGFDLVAFDASLMSMTEVASSVAPYTDVFVASAQVGESQGFDYDEALGILRSNPDQVTGALLGSEIVRAYQQQYNGQSTLSAFNAVNFASVRSALQSFTTATASATLTDFNAIKAARDSARSFVNPAFRDLGKLMETVASDTSVSTTIRNAAQQVATALRGLVLAEATNPQVQSGMSIYFPDELLTSSPDVDYPVLFQTFNTQTGWFSFLEDFTSSADGRAGGFESDQFEGASGNNIEALAHRFFGLSGANVFDSLTLDRKTDVDWYSFTIASVGAAGNRVRLTHDHTVDGAAATMELALFQVDPDGLSNEVSVVNTTAGQATVSLVGQPVGEYRIRVRAANAVARYTLEATAPTVTPANDWIDTDATNANATQQKAYRLNWTGDARQFTGLVLPDVGAQTSFDWFTISGPAIVDPPPTRLRLSSPTNETFQVRLLDAGGGVVQTAMGTAAVEVAATLAANAQYFIEVSSNNAASASYSLGLSPIAQLAGDSMAPRVADVRLRGTAWAGAAWYSVPGGAAQLDTLSWTNVDQIQLVFDENVEVSKGDLLITAVVGSYAFRGGIDGFSYDDQTFIATWTLTAPIQPDRILLTLSDGVNDQAGNALDGEWNNQGDTFPSGDGTAGTDFQFRIDLLPGDVNHSGNIDVFDPLFTRLRVGLQEGQPNYDMPFDVNADGRIDVLDVLLIRLRLGQTTPAGQPPIQGLIAAGSIAAPEAVPTSTPAVFGSPSEVAGNVSAPELSKAALIVGAIDDVMAELPERQIATSVDALLRRYTAKRQPIKPNINIIGLPIPPVL